MAHGLFKRTIKTTFYSLRNRNYRLYFIGQFISNTGNWITAIALTLLVLKLTGSGLAIGLLAACQFGPILFLSPWGGAIADRVDKRKMILWTQGLQMVQSFALGIVAFMPHPSLPALYLLALAGGILLAFDNPVRRSFVTEMVPTEDIPNAVVLNSTIINVTRIFGPALAGLLVVTLGYGWAFVIDGLTYIAVLFCIYIMRTAELRRPIPKPKAKGEIRAAVRYVMSIPLLWISFGMLAAIGTLSYNFNVTLPLFVTHTLHSTDGIYTILYAIFGCGAVVSSLIVAHRGLVKMQHIIWGAFTLGLTMLLVAFCSTITLAAPAIFLMGMASILYLTATTAIVQVEAKQEMHGRVLALQTVLLAGTTPFGGPLLGWMADVMGARSPLILGGVVCLIAGVFGYFATKKYIDEPRAAKEIITDFPK